VGSGDEWHTLDEETAKAMESARNSDRTNVDVGEVSYDFINGTTPRMATR